MTIDNEVARRRTFAIISHPDAGKTTLTEKLLMYAGAIHIAGSVKARKASRHATSDWMEIEKQRGISVASSVMQMEYQDCVINLLDTPGHQDFSEDTYRVLTAVDAALMVIDAANGVEAQTLRLLEVCRARNTPILTFINKMDREAADPDRVKNELSAINVIPDDWGGDVQFVPVSAHTGDGVDALLDAILLQSELLELEAPRDVRAAGLVIESSLDKGRGPVANLLIQRGTLRQGEIVLAGEHYGRVRAMLDENGKPIKEAGPSIPVQILGLAGTANAGDEFVSVESEKQAREVADHRLEVMRDQRMTRQQAAKLENMFSSMESGQKKMLNVLVKADVRGSFEAIQGALLDLGNDEVVVNLVAGGVGGLNESDVNLAMTAGAVVFGFNVRADTSARRLAEQEGLEIRYYAVIYDLLDDVRQALEGMLDPEQREEIVGTAEVRDVFRSPKFGAIAGCMVVEGTMFRNKPIRVLRDDVVIYQGELESLRRFKDDVQEVRTGFECGIGVKNYNDVKAGDKIEVYETREFARTL